MEYLLHSFISMFISLVLKFAVSESYLCNISFFRFPLLLNKKTIIKIRFNVELLMISYADRLIRLFKCSILNNLIGQKQQNHGAFFISYNINDQVFSWYTSFALIMTFRMERLTFLSTFIFIFHNYKLFMELFGCFLLFPNNFTFGSFLFYFHTNESGIFYVNSLNILFTVLTV